MWHEARRREKATQKLIIEHKKRAEKRREENRVDPTSLLQVHGIKSKLHIDANTFKQAEKSLVVWQGDKNVTIDRFDVRATLSSIPTDAEAIVARKRCKSLPDELKRTTILDIDESDSMKKLLTYERYRLLMQNDLNQVSEQTRLKLVVKSEYLTDAHMKKLQNNRFGTSGESDYATTSQSGSGYSMNNNNNNTSSGSRLLDRARDIHNNRKGAQVPPPASLRDTNDRDNNLDEPQHNQSIIDLDEHENFELDGIDDKSISSNSRRANEITSKYGLTSDEFGLLAVRDQNELQTLEMIKELKKLVETNQKRDKQGAADLSTRTGVYGPSLPPDMIATTRSPAYSETSSVNGGSPVRQRSPSGGNIPLRNGDKSSANRSPPSLLPFSRHEDKLLPNNLDSDRLTDAATTRTTLPSRDRYNKSGSTSLECKKPVQSSSSNIATAERPPAQQHTRYSRDLPSEHHPDIRPTPRARSPLTPPPQLATDITTTRRRSRSRSIEADQDEELAESKRPAPRKRAETPLAYKRHYRSSRSLSRERRLTQYQHHQTTDNHRQHHNHHRSSSSNHRNATLPSSTRHLRHPPADDRYPPSQHAEYGHGSRRAHGSYQRSPTRSRSASFTGSSRSSFSSAYSSRLKTRSRSSSYSSFYSNGRSSNPDLRRSSRALVNERRHRDRPTHFGGGGGGSQHPPARRRPKKRRTGRKRRRRGGRRRRR